MRVPRKLRSLAALSNVHVDVVFLPPIGETRDLLLLNADIGSGIGRDMSGKSEPWNWPER